MIKVNVSSHIPLRGWPREGVPEYIFAVHAYGGPMLGVEIREFDWTLEVDSRRGLLSVESFRSDGDRPGQPLGVFREVLSDDQLRELHGLVIGANLGIPRTPMKRHPGNTERVYRLLEPPPRGLIEDRINDSDEETNATLAPLRHKINVLLADSFNHPERAARPEIQHARQDSADAFEVTITNIGVEKICFTDPRWITPTGVNQRAVVLVSEFSDAPPGVPTSVDWKTLALQPLSPRPSSGPLITLDSKGVWKATTLPWKRLPGKRYVAYLVWANYAGEPAAGGVYRTRGRADSPRLAIDP